MPRYSANPIRVAYWFLSTTRNVCGIHRGSPLNVRMGVHEGTFHSFTLPAQLPVANIALLGEKRTWAIGRSSPICEPRLAKFCVVSVQ